MVELELFEAGKIGILEQSHLLIRHGDRTTVIINDDKVAADLSYDGTAAATTAEGNGPFLVGP